MTGRRILALLMAAAGGVWFLQGVGLFTAIDSFMNYDIRWSVAGIGMVIVALLIWNQKPKSQ